MLFLMDVTDTAWFLLFFNCDFLNSFYVLAIFGLDSDFQVFMLRLLNISVEQDFLVIVFSTKYHTYLLRLVDVKWYK